MLANLYGAYEISRNSKSEYVVVMENVFFGIDVWETYDLKGTRWRRFAKPPAAAMDVNFLLDRNSEPIFSSVDVLTHLRRTLDFLTEQGFVDYSLTLVVSIDDPAQQYMDGNRIRLRIANYVK